MKTLTPLRLLCCVAFVAFLVLGLLAYKHICPGDTNACFNKFAAHGSMVFACLGFIPMYAGRAFFGTLGEGPPSAPRRWNWWVARVLFVSGSTVVCCAVGWFCGCILATLINTG